MYKYHRSRRQDFWSQVLSTHITKFPKSILINRKPDVYGTPLNKNRIERRKLSKIEKTWKHLKGLSLKFCPEPSLTVQVFFCCDVVDYICYMPCNRLVLGYQGRGRFYFLLGEMTWLTENWKRTVRALAPYSSYRGSGPLHWALFFAIVERLSRYMYLTLSAHN